MSANPFLDPDFLQCPFPVFRQMRETAPVMYMDELKTFVVTGYTQAREILLAPERFSNQVNIPGRTSEAATRLVDENWGTTEEHAK